MNQTILNLIEQVQNKYQESLSNYENNCIVLEFGDLEYLDSDTNIFSYDEHPLLMELIDKYRQIQNKKYNRDYQDARNQLSELQKKENDYINGISHRIKQIENGKAKKRLESEISFIIKFQYRLELAITLIDNCLIPFEEYVKKCEEEGIEICEDENYTLFLVNKCLILSHTSLFNDECITLIDKLTKRMKGRMEYSNSLLFSIGTLALRYRLFLNTIILSKQLIDKLRKKVVVNSANDNEKYMFFSAYMMLISSYEYSGQYNEALATLIGEKM